MFLNLYSLLYFIILLVRRVENLRLSHNLHELKTVFMYLEPSDNLCRANSKVHLILCFVGRS